MSQSMSGRSSRTFLPPDTRRSPLRAAAASTTSRTFSSASAAACLKWTATAYFFLSTLFIIIFASAINLDIVDGALGLLGPVALGDLLERLGDRRVRALDQPLVELGDALGEDPVHVAVGGGVDDHDLVLDVQRLALALVERLDEALTRIATLEEELVTMREQAGEQEQNETNEDRYPDLWGGGPASPGLLIALPELGTLSWRCDDDKMFRFAFRPAGANIRVAYETSGGQRRSTNLHPGNVLSTPWIGPSTRTVRWFGGRRWSARPSAR